MGDCLFCRIVQKLIPATPVYETDTVLAFRDINPKAPVHVLVIPKIHIESLMAIQSAHGSIIMEIHKAIQVVAKSEKIVETGFRVAVNNGKDSGQAVPHLHYHVIGGRHMNWPPG